MGTIFVKISYIVAVALVACLAPASAGAAEAKSVSIAHNR